MKIKLLLLLSLLFPSLALAQLQICQNGKNCSVRLLKTTSGNTSQAALCMTNNGGTYNSGFLATAASIYTYRLFSDSVCVTAAADVWSYDINNGLFLSTGRWRGPDGTAALPSVGFTTDPNTGWFLAAVDSPALSAGGATRLAVSTNYTVSTNAGGFALSPVAFASFVAAATAGNGVMQVDGTNATLRYSNGVAWKPVTFTREFSGYLPVQAIGAAVKVASTYSPSYGVATNISGVVQVAGTGGGSWIAQVYNATTATVICAVSNGTCAAGAGTEYPGAVAGCSGVANAGDQLVLRVDTSACTTAPALQLNATILGG